MPKALTFQDLVLNLQKFWADRGCVLQQPYDIEVGAGTMARRPFCASWAPSHTKSRMCSPRAPRDGRYGDNPTVSTSTCSFR